MKKILMVLMVVILISIVGVVLMINNFKSLKVLFNTNKLNYLISDYTSVGSRNGYIYLIDGINSSNKIYKYDDSGYSFIEEILMDNRIYVIYVNGRDTEKVDVIDLNNGEIQTVTKEQIDNNSLSLGYKVYYIHYPKNEPVLYYKDFTSGNIYTANDLCTLGEYCYFEDEKCFYRMNLNNNEIEKIFDYQSNAHHSIIIGKKRVYHSDGENFYCYNTEKNLNYVIGSYLYDLNFHIVDIDENTYAYSDNNNVYLVSNDDIENKEIILSNTEPNLLHDTQFYPIELISENLLQISAQTLGTHGTKEIFWKAEEYDYYDLNTKNTISKDSGFDIIGLVSKNK